MRRIRILLSNFPLESQLTESQLHYVKNVLRIDNGSELEIFDGAGQAYRATLQFTGKKTAQLMLQSTLAKQSPPSLHIHLGLCISKPQHMDIALQKAAELGVSVITPIISERCESKRLDNKFAHWQEIVVNACQQSGYNYLPTLLAPQLLPKWVHDLPQPSQKWICVPEQPMRLQNMVVNQSAILLTGPEGGFSEAEIEVAMAAGFMRTGLGPRILRTETAPLVAISVLQFLAGDLRPEG
jgi:16S rRNA (uracil1498-N3)-methyltransferase